MKKIVCVLLVLALASALFAGCGKKEEKEDTSVNYESIYKEKAAAFASNEHPIGVIVMEDLSTITFELYPEQAKETVNNFISLANKGFYDGLIFHRVIDGFMIQGGDPDGTGNGGPGYTIPGEFADNGYNNTLAHEVGVLSMARRGSYFNPASAYNTAGSQFFICVARASHLDGQYAAFGKVLDGMDIALKISKTATDANDRPLSAQKMAYVRVDTHGLEYPEPHTAG